jgi:4a-hydroxytetrahydrobiopterin dehydratase
VSERLAEKQCKPCQGGVSALEGDELKSLSKQLGSGWEVVAGHHLEKAFEFEDFAQALAFVNRIGAVAEEQGHHPDISLGYGKVVVQIWTHKVDGLTESDFIFAAKTDDVLSP